MTQVRNPQLGMSQQSSISLTANSIATAAMLIPGIGTAVGALIAVGASIFGTIFGNRAALKALKRQLNRDLLKRYNNTVFTSALQRLAPAMEQLVELGLQPGTPEFEAMLEKKLYPDIGYKANCNIDLWNPGIPGRPNTRFLMAKINNTGHVDWAVPAFDLNNGKQWFDICKQLKIAALQQWAEEQASEGDFQHQLQKQKDEAKRQMITRALVVAGLGMLLIGFTLRQKKKLATLNRASRKGGAK
jgi:hypothetical protein